MCYAALTLFISGRTCCPAFLVSYRNQTPQPRRYGQVAPQHFLNFFPLPQGHGSLRPGRFGARPTGGGGGCRCQSSLPACKAFPSNGEPGQAVVVPDLGSNRRPNCCKWSCRRRSSGTGLGSAECRARTKASGAGTVAGRNYASSATYCPATPPAAAMMNSIVALAGFDFTRRSRTNTFETPRTPGRFFPEGRDRPRRQRWNRGISAGAAA